MQLRFDGAEWAALVGFCEYRTYHNLLFLLYFLTIMGRRGWYASSRIHEPLREAFAMATLPRCDSAFVPCGLPQACTLNGNEFEAEML